MLLDELSGFGQSFDDVVLVFDVHHVAAFDAAHGVAGQHEPSSRAVWSEWGACFVACGCEQPNKLRKVCTTHADTGVDALYQIVAFLAREVRFAADSARLDGPLAVCRRTHARISCSNVRRTIQRLDSANSVYNCAVFLASPR